MAKFIKMLDVCERPQGNSKIHAKRPRKSTISVARCHYCKTVIRSAMELTTFDGKNSCAYCKKYSLKNCVMCATPFISRIHNKKTCDNVDSRCGYLYQLQRARERQQELKARAVSFIAETEGGY